MSVKFLSPASLFGTEDSGSPRNAIEKHFALNLRMYNQDLGVTTGEFGNLSQGEPLIPFGGITSNDRTISYLG